jgi:hypothetical protein
VVGGRNPIFLELIAVVGAVEAVDEGASGQVGLRVEGVDPGWTMTWTTAPVC